MEEDAIRAKLTLRGVAAAESAYASAEMSNTANAAVEDFEKEFKADASASPGVLSDLSRAIKLQTERSGQDSRLSLSLETRFDSARKLERVVGESARACFFFVSNTHTQDARTKMLMNESSWPTAYLVGLEPSVHNALLLSRASRVSRKRASLESLEFLRKPRFARWRVVWNRKGLSESCFRLLIVQSQTPVHPLLSRPNIISNSIILRQARAHVAAGGLQTSGQTHAGICRRAAWRGFPAFACERRKKRAHRHTSRTTTVSLSKRRRRTLSASSIFLK